MKSKRKGVPFRFRLLCQFYRDDYGEGEWEEWRKHTKLEYAIGSLNYFRRLYPNYQYKILDTKYDTYIPGDLII